MIESIVPHSNAHTYNLHSIDMLISVNNQLLKSQSLNSLLKATDGELSQTAEVKMIRDKAFKIQHHVINAIK